MSQENLQASLHAQIRRQYPARGAHEWFLLTDGSGYKDGVVGSSTIVFSPKHQVMRTVESGGTQSSVARAEFQALLDGLRIIDETCVEMTKAMRLFDTRIYWVADREDLVLSVARNLEKENMPTLYGRKTNSDLWRAFSYYEERFQITPVHFPKSAVPLWFTRLDERSTEIRTMFLEHAETWAEMDAELQMMGYPWKAPAKFKALVTDADYIKSTTSDVTFTEWMSQKMAEHTPDVMRLVSAFMVGDLREEDHNGTCRIMPALP